MKIKIIINEEKDFKPHKMYDPKNKDKDYKGVDTKTKKDHEDYAKKGFIHIKPEELRQILRDEGGAAGIDPFKLKFGDDKEKEIKDALEKMPDVGQHEDGDYVLADDKEIIIKIIQEEIKFVLERRKKKRKKKKKKSSGKKDACYRKVKSRYKVWPSAYASGALVRCRKVGAKNWGNKSKKKK
tara:strand:- start:908 stop:1456 length:549 start_codon:yes stop_codon:yes gene_type:complete